MKDTHVKSTGWDLLNKGPYGLEPPSAEAHKKNLDDEMALCNAFANTFCKGTGPETLAAIESYVYRHPLLEEGPNMTENNLARSGMRDVVEMINAQILRSQRGA